METTVWVYCTSKLIHKDHLYFHIFSDSFNETDHEIGIIPKGHALQIQNIFPNDLSNFLGKP